VQRIPVKITLDPLPDNYVLRPGMNVQATIFTK
jgi:multidrug resistance efflux pump